MHKKECTGCGNVFDSPYGKRRTCSEECAKKSIVKAKTVYPEDTIDKIIKMRNEGKTLEEIADSLGCSRGLVCSMIKENGLKMTREQINDANIKKWDKVKRYDSEGRLCCCRCKEWKSPCDFRNDKKNKTGKKHSCRVCDKEKHQSQTKRKERELDEKDLKFIQDFVAPYNLKSPSEEGPE